MELVTKTFNIRKDQEQELITLAARRQVHSGSYTSISDIAREIIDAGLLIVKQRESVPPDQVPVTP